MHRLKDTDRQNGFKKHDKCIWPTKTHLNMMILIGGKQKDGKDIPHKYRSVES